MRAWVRSSVTVVTHPSSQPTLTISGACDRDRKKTNLSISEMASLRMMAAWFHKQITTATASTTSAPVRRAGRDRQIQRQGMRGVALRHLFAEVPAPG
jgi:hypothetical protein